MSIPELSGYVAAMLVFLTFYMKTMVPLRLTGICSNCAFITYGFLGDLYPVLILHLILLPLNVFRLQQMLRLTRQVQEAAHGDLNMDWLRPFASVVQVPAGSVLFRQGDTADRMFVVGSGRFRLVESGIELTATEVVGEFALLAPEGTRTQTLECIEAGTLLQISYANVEQLFFQNPRFGFALLRLITRRLFNNIERLETELAQR